MSWEEKRAWIALVVAVVTYTAYLVVILVRAGGGSLADVAYESTLLWTIGISIVSSIVLEMLTGGSLQPGSRKKDMRDLQIFRFGEYAGHWVLVAGGVAVLGMALAEVSHFWIANVIYAAFTLSAIVGSIVKILVYRKGFPPW